MAKYNVHAGHNPEGKIACGASDLLNESRENRLVKGELINYLRQYGNTVYDCTEDNGKNQMDVLEKIVNAMRILLILISHCISILAETMITEIVSKAV